MHCLFHVNNHLIFAFLIFFICYFSPSDSRKTASGRTPLGVNRANNRNKGIPLSGPNIHQVGKLNERKELIEKVKKKIEKNSKRQEALLASKPIDIILDQADKIEGVSIGKGSGIELIETNTEKYPPKRPKLLSILKAKKSPN